MSRIAVIRSASPERPAPSTKTRGSRDPSTSVGERVEAVERGVVDG